MADLAGVPEITRAEHLGPSSTGDNVDAKKVANYAFGADGNWGRVPLNLADKPYDYIGLTNPDVNDNYQTIKFYQGGSGGSVVRTLALTFDSSSNITSITRS